MRGLHRQGFPNPKSGRYASGAVAHLFATADEACPLGSKPDSGVISGYNCFSLKSGIQNALRNHLSRAKLDAFCG
jgi:hypothetical protein